jgi:EpsD family peptidyl-prolyl cis-trans isomerase
MLHTPKLNVFAALILVMLSACDKNQVSTPVAATVNDTSISVAEIEHKLKQYSHFPEDKKKNITQTLLKGTIDTELLRQAAIDEKLDQDESVRLSLLQANRLILANAYVEKQRNSVAKPTPAEVKVYYDQHPGLFGERRIYELREVSFQPKPDNEAEILAKLGDGIAFEAFTRWLTEQKIRHATRSQVMSPDDMPENVLAKLSKLSVGGVSEVRGANHLTILRIDNFQPQPVSLEQATPAIEGKIMELRKTEAMEAAFKRLHEKAKIKYLPPYSEIEMQAAGH